jgi:N-acetylglucosaminyldiphosphoundecaprenol N-acetyl-beta-D-mannosaminyltransferase
MQDKRFFVLGTAINSLTWKAAIETISAWAEKRESRYICICNVHSVVTAKRDFEFQMILNNADMATADGAPIAWVISHIQKMRQERINGPDLMWRYLAKAEQLQQRPFFYGGSEETLQKLVQAITDNFPRLQIAGAYSPPYQRISDEEDQTNVEMINRSGAHIVFVGLGCPKQERWMAAHCGQIQAVMIGVGAAFDYHAGTIQRAPVSWQRNGFEWLYRLLMEPRRLLKRYAVTNTFFLIEIAKQFIVKKTEEKY